MKKASLFLTLGGKRYTREAVRSTFGEASEVAERLRKKGYSARVVRRSSEIHRKGYCYVIYARKK